VGYLKKIEQLNGKQLSNLDKRNDLNYENNHDDDDDDDYNIEEDLEERVNEDVFKMHKIGESIIERSRKRQKDFEIKSKKSFELIKLELENGKRELLEKLKRSSNFNDL
jgi:hypothetical protein